jgi:ribosomal protein S18 acetylase RimI-like enzyme
MPKPTGGFPEKPEQETTHMPGRPFEIVPFDIGAYDEARALWLRCEGVNLTDADTEDIIRSFLERNPAMSFMAAAGGRIVGTILGGHDGRRGYMYHLAVDAAWRKRGIGRRLADACLKALKAAGIGKVHVFVYTANASGLAFWEAAGWTRRTDIHAVSKIAE